MGIVQNESTWSSTGQAGSLLSFLELPCHYYWGLKFEQKEGHGGVAPPSTEVAEGEGSPFQRAWPGLGGIVPGSGGLETRDAVYYRFPCLHSSTFPQLWPGRGCHCQKAALSFPEPHPRGHCLHPPRRRAWALPPRSSSTKGHGRRVGGARVTLSAFLWKSGPPPHTPISSDRYKGISPALWGSPLAPALPTHPQGPVAEEGLNIS